MVLYSYSNLSYTMTTEVKYGIVYTITMQLH